MSVLQSISNLVAATRAQPSFRTNEAFKPYLPVEDSSNIDYRRARSRLISLYRHLEELAELTNVRTRFKLDLPDAVSSSG